jgi:peroxiredoxin Q/BCP
VVGVSADKPESQRKFVDKFGLTFPMVPDVERTIIDAFGARKVLGVAAQRSTFLIDPEGRVARVWEAVKVSGHAEEVLTTIESLSDRIADRSRDVSEEDCD